SRGREAMQKAYALLISLIVGGLIGLFRSYGALAEQLRDRGRPQVWLEKIQGWLHIPDTLNFPQWLNPLARGQMQGLSFEPSVLLIGAGMITGLRVSLSMLAGSVLLYFFVAPHLLAMDAADLNVAGYVPSFKLSVAGDFNHVRWALWGGTAVMVLSSLTQLAL